MTWLRTGRIDGGVYPYRTDLGRVVLIWAFRL